MPFCSTIFGSNFFTVSMSYAIHILNGMIECSIYIADLSLLQSLRAQANLFADRKFAVDLAGWKPETPKKSWFFFKLYLET